jgi:small subunit ribosomal protein S7
MSRKPKKIKKEPIGPDFKYHNISAAIVISHLMKKGKFSTAETIFHEAMDIIKEKTQQDPLTVFEKAIKNVKPLLEIKPRRVGGATYQVPVEVRHGRGVTLAIRWIMLYARQRKGQPMSGRLAAELMDAANNTGNAIKKRDDTHRMAEANKRSRLGGRRRTVVGTRLLPAGF